MNLVEYDHICVYKLHDLAAAQPVLPLLNLNIYTSRLSRTSPIRPRPKMSFFSLPSAAYIIHITGLATLSLLAARIINFVRLYTTPGTLSRYARPNAYALVTGASDGIGKAFAFSLASKGFNIILHGRNATKLDAVRAELLAAHPDVKCRVVIAEAGQSHGMKAAVEGVVSSLADLDGPLTVLVNNVGGAFPHGVPALTTVSEQDWSYTDTSINMNVRFTMQLTRALLPTLKASQPSLVLTMGSMAGSIGIPYNTLYSGFKSCLMTWSKALCRELQMQGAEIEMIGLVAGEVRATTYLREEPAFMQPAASTWVESALERVGSGYSVVAPYWPHALTIGAVEMLPEGVQTLVVKGVTKGLVESFNKKQ